MSQSIFCFGDSITHGAVDSRGGWADRLKQYYFQAQIEASGKWSPSVYNLGIDGDTADDLVKRIGPEIEAQRKPWTGSHDIYVIGIGINDSRAQDVSDNYVSSLAHYVDQLSQITKIIQKRSNNILFVGLNPVDDKLVGEIGEDIYKLERVKEFDQTLQQFCEEYQLPIVHIFEPMLKLVYRSMLFDGLHPNDAGHEWMYEQIKPQIQRMIQ